MRSFWFTVLRLLKALRRAWHWPDFRTTVSLVVATLLSATLFYSEVEGWRRLDALYFSVATIATVSYGDLAPVTDAGKVFTIVFMLVGIGLFVALVTQIARALIAPTKNDDDTDG